MNGALYLTSGQIHLMGEQYDSKLCFNSTDDFFDCLDREHQVNVNTKLCGKQFAVWKSSCDPAVRRQQMMFRRKDAQDKQLYTQAQLDAYNRAKNNA